MRLANLLFDLDGTLVDTLPGIEYSARVAVRAVLPDRELLPMRPRIGPPIREIFHQMFPNISAVVMDQLEKQFRASYDSNGWQKSVAYPGVPETMRQLIDIGAQCFVVTNKPTIPTQRILKYLSLYDYFKAIVSPDSRPVRFESKSQIVEFLIPQYGLAQPAVVVGDSEDDVRAAQANGLSFIAVAYGYGKAADIYRQHPACLGVLAEFRQLLAMAKGVD